MIRFGRVQFIVKKLSATGTPIKEEDFTICHKPRKSTAKRRQSVRWETVNYTGENTQQNTGGVQSLCSLVRIGDDSVKYAEKGLGLGIANLKPTSLAEIPQERICRICLCEEDDPTDPIVMPCKCLGTMKEVHVKCFKKWLTKHAVRKESSNMVSIVWDKLKCELCGQEVESNKYHGKNRNKLFL